MTEKSLGQVAFEVFRDDPALLGTYAGSWQQQAPQLRNAWQAAAEAVAEEIKRRDEPCECMSWPVPHDISKRELDRRIKVNHHADCPMNPEPKEIKP